MYQQTYLWFSLLFSGILPAQPQQYYPGDTPYNPIPYTIMYGYQGYETDNISRPHSQTDLGMPGFWPIPQTGTQGLDKMVWFRVKIPAAMWWEFRVDESTQMFGVNGGMQVAIFPDNPQLAWQQDPPIYGGSGGWASFADHHSVYMWLEPGYYLVSVDGYGPSIGKFRFSVLRSTNGCCELYFFPHPFLPDPSPQIIYE